MNIKLDDLIKEKYKNKKQEKYRNLDFDLISFEKDNNIKWEWKPRFFLVS